MVDPIQTGATAAIVSIVLGAFKLVENISKKRNGAGSETQLALLNQRVESLEKNIEETHQKLVELLKEFYIFREESRLWRVKYNPRSRRQPDDDHKII